MEKWEREELLKCLIRTLERRYLVQVVPEYKFAKEAIGRQWKADFAIMGHKVLVEIDGGAYIRRKDGSVGGRHNSPIGKAKDDEKGNWACILGWRGMTFTWKQVSNGEAEALLDRALGGK